MTDEPFVPTPANDPDDEPLPGEGADDSVTQDLETSGVPASEHPSQPDYFSHDTPIVDSDLVSNVPKEDG